MTLNYAIEKIVTEISTQFGADDPQENEAFKATIRQICATELEPILTAQAQAPQVAQQVVMQASPTKRGRNGYNLFSSELRHKLVAEMGSEEEAKKEFNARGGVTKYCSAEWAKLTQPEKDVYNATAKAERMQGAVQAVGGPANVVQIGAPKRAPSLWQRFQKAFGAELKAKTEAGEEVPHFENIGARTKACSAAYKPLKADQQALQTYLTQWSA